MRRAVPGIVMSTMGQPARADLGVSVEGWTPGDARFAEDPAGRQSAADAARAARRAERIAAYAELRDQGAGICEAGARLDPPVRDKTAYTYEREYKALREAS